jgi:hypothetical protein
MNKSILITGDVVIDHLYHPAEAKEQGENWTLYPSMQETLLPGGAFLLAEFLEQAAKFGKHDISVIRQKIPSDLMGTVARQLIQSKVMLAKFPNPNKNEKPKEWIRVSKYCGYTSVQGNHPEVPALQSNPEKADLVVLDDAGNLFRESETAFPTCLDDPDIPVVYKISRPLTEGKLWKKICSRKSDWVAIVQAKDIRWGSQVNVSKALSWERTAMELVFQLRKNPSLCELQKIPFLVVLFGCEGALLYPKDPEEKPLLIFDPLMQEGFFSDSVQGKELSMGSVFTAAFSTVLLNEGIGAITQAIKKGLGAMRNLLWHGFIQRDNEVAYPFEEIFSGKNFQFSECQIDHSTDLDLPDPRFWRILDEKTKLSKPLVTKDIVRHKSQELLKEIPVGNYGKLQTIDRVEIEQFNSIRNLIMEYLEDPKALRPLCIAVFGPPGSGKSFGIKQVLNSLGRKNVPTMTFNISQYGSFNDLIADFHKIRDSVLAGDIPVAFFDEFDSDLDSRPLGWLKYFLGPMQDGEFKEGEAIHPIGKSIFVFAGGTRSSFAEFEANGNFKEQGNPKEQKEEPGSRSKRENDFREAKGPDFISRLRGFIDILGPNPNNLQNRTDETFIIRRGKILRVNFENTEKTKQLISPGGTLRIDDSVLRAILNVPFYKHGNRSMTALLDMSRLTGKEKFDLSSLPNRDLLDMHVDAEVFLWLAEKERFYTLIPVEERAEISGRSPIEWESEIIAKIAEKIHYDYCNQQILKGKKTKTTTDWEKLPDEKKKSNLDAAKDIPSKLGMIGMGIRKIRQSGNIPTPDITDAEVDLLAKHEHDRWYREEIMQQYKLGKEPDTVLKTNPCLVSWEELPEDEKTKDYEAIYSLPRILKDAGYYIFRFENYDILDEKLVRIIAVTIHDDYCRNRKKAGETVKTNSSLVPFGDLPEKLKESNYDTARTIPKKLKQLGITLQKAPSGEKIELLELTPEEELILSKHEHTRWLWQKILQGYVYGPEKSDEKMTHPNILPWEKLTNADQEKDRENVRLIPKIIREAGYKAVREK